MTESDYLTAGTRAVESTQRTRVDDTSEFVDIQAISEYDFVEHCYDGSHGFRDGKYIIPHAREVFYNNRRLISNFRNFYRPIIRAMVDPVFSYDIVRETDSEMYNEFIDNCDNAGTPLQDMIKSAIEYARISGVSFIVMDNMPTNNGAETVQAAIEQRAFPYIYTKRIQDRYDQTLDQWGNIIDIAFWDRKEKINGVEKNLYRRWDAVGWELFYVSIGDNGKKGEVVIDQGAHNLGMVPVIVVDKFLTKKGLKTDPCPPLYDIARLNFELYNRQSEIRWMEMCQAFAVFYMQDAPPDLVLGVNNFINLGPAAQITPGFASPPGEHLVNLVANASALVEDIYRMAHQAGVIGVKTESGVAKEWDFRAEEMVLKQTAACAVELEQEIAALFGEYTGAYITVDTKYPTDFQPTYHTDAIKADLDILKEMPPQEIAEAIWRDLLEHKFHNDKEKLEAIIDALDFSLNARIQSMKDAAAGAGVPPVDTETETETEPQGE